MNAHELLDALVDLIGPVLPEGFAVSANHDFEAGLAYDRASEESMEALLGDPANANGGGFITHRMGVVRSDSPPEDLPPFVRRIMSAGDPGPELESTCPDGGAGTYLRGYLLDPDRPAPRRDASAPHLGSRALLEASLRALDGLQDFMCEERREPWPRSGSAAVPAPSGRVARGRLLLWYGDEDDPVLAFPPVEVGPATDLETGDLTPDG